MENITRTSWEMWYGLAKILLSCMFAETLLANGEYPQECLCIHTKHTMFANPCQDIMGNIAWVGKHCVFCMYAETFLADRECPQDIKGNV
jgi:hypothetical protein